MGNHFNANGDLVIEDRTLFRRVGWQGHRRGEFYADPPSRAVEPGGYSPVYVQIATDRGAGWDD